MMKRRIRKAAFFMTAVVWITSMPVCPIDVQAEENAVVIRTEEELLEFGRACTSESFSAGKTVRLEADLDLSGQPFYPIPVFSGTFEGNGHTISGLSIGQTGSNLGLFRYLEEAAVVENLTVQGVLKPEGSRMKIGGIAGTNKGIIRNCTFLGRGEALENLGGIAGFNEETGVIEGCRNQAELTGNRRVGGIAGENAGTIQDSYNEGEINTTSEGIDEDSKEKNNISVDRQSIETTVVVEKVNDIGGIAGLSSGTVRQCGNEGAVGYEHTGYNIGGIVGRQKGILALCDNSGAVMGRKDVGGIAGQLEPFLTIEYGQDTFDKINDQVDQIGDTTDAITQELRSTADASIGNLDRVDELLKEIRDITRGKKDVRKIKREEYDEEAGKQLDQIDEILANMEIDLGSRSAEGAAGRVQANVKRARELLDSLKNDDFIYDDDMGISDELQYIYQVLTELQECAGDISEDTEIMITDGVGGVVDGVRDFEDDIESLRVASKDFLDLTREYKDQLFGDVDDLDEDLTGQLDQLYKELDFLSDNLKSGKDQLRLEKDRLDTQLDQMQEIVVEGKERIESERNRASDDNAPLFEDISESATELTNGMILGCSNQGNIFSDFQAGGVVGTIGVELDLDPEEDIETYGEESLYMNRYAQASVRGCRNEGDVAVKRDYAGGIAGNARIGVLASNQNYGDISTEDGDYAGGIAGLSQSLISGSYTMCQVSGNAYTGGIAGQGKNLKNNCAMADIVTDGGEWKGSIAGNRDEDGEIAENFYVDDGLGAVDGVTFLGEAEGISYDALLLREGLPSEFSSLTVTFLADDQVVEQIVCQYGQSLTGESIPEVPEKEGFFHHWEDSDLSNIRKNHKIHAVYVPWTITIADSDAPMPMMLAEAAFYPDTQVLVKEAEQKPSVPAGYREIKAYSYEILDAENRSLPDAVKLHVLAGKADSAGIVRDGAVEVLDVVKDGEYLIFEAGVSGDIVLMKSKPGWMIFMILGVLAVGAAAVTTGKMKKK